MFIRKKKNKSTLINGVRKTFVKIYYAFEKPYSPVPFYLNKYDKAIRPLVKTNNIIKRFYKREELVVDDYENLESITFKSQDGIELAGFVYTPNKESNKWLIACHWFAGHKCWALHHAKIFTKMGYNVLVFDFRGHGNSQENSTTMGLREEYDLLAAIEWLKNNKKIDSLALYGTSMGGYCVNYVSLKYSEELKKLNLKFVISDAAYGSVYRLLIHVRNIYLKIINKKKTKKIVLKIMQKHNELEQDVDFGKASVFELIKKGYKPIFPTLFFHSKDDKVTPPTDTYEYLLERNKYIEDDYLIYSYSMHTQAIRQHFLSYNYKLASFISKMDNNKADFDRVTKEWSLVEFSDQDQDEKNSN
ncbi:alpha/beta fold hydrolase [Spiroplasma gladiatoris]|uniref:Alpha/beta fold hydrolase n=1 Tax=Spiroplasma gladiatoris TaxID=2143 RepID=A0A4P7AHZ7_9MOLU|nr:alpha/beta fold hydrolase [Spiroplasma gladiatoris]QBQ07316.1 alpha/beta fold hydrolase [Spiroplasma gladiatoris]